MTLDFKLCTGCRICEQICSLYHRMECNPERSHIRIVCSEEEGFPVTVPVSCFNCTLPVCEKVCPTGATYRDGETKAMLVDEDKCLGCSACVYACPFGATYIDPQTLKAARCDLCGGDPMCVKMCPTEALKFEHRDDVSMKLRRSALENLITVNKTNLFEPGG